MQKTACLAYLFDRFAHEFSSLPPGDGRAGPRTHAPAFDDRRSGDWERLHGVDDGHVQRKHCNENVQDQVPVKNVKT